MRITLSGVLVIALMTLFLIAGCGGAPSPLVINGISPSDNVIRGDRLRLTVTGVEYPSTLTIWVNDKSVIPEVVYLNNLCWVVVFTAQTELEVGNNTIVVVDDNDDRQDSISLEVHASRLPIEPNPSIISMAPQNRHTVVPNQLVQITMGKAQLVGKQVIVEMIELNGDYTDLTLISTIDGDIIKFSMPPFEGEKVMFLISVGEKEIFDYFEFREDKG
jgi:hypothetical protein